MQLSSPDAATDFAALQKRLSELDEAITNSTSAWEKTASELEDFMREYNKLHE